MRFEIIDTHIAGVRLVRRKQIGDARGFLERLFCAEELEAAGWCKPIVQMNHTFTKKLSADNLCSLLIPEGCAHGFQTLTDDVELIYLHSAAYAPQAEDGLNVRNSRLGIPWPLEIAELSLRDTHHPMLPTAYVGLPIDA